MQEVIARGGKVLMITNDTSEILNENIRFKFQLPDTDSRISAFLLTINAISSLPCSIIEEL